MKKMILTGIACFLLGGLAFATANNHLAPLVVKETALPDTNYQPLENQRLSTTNSPTFAGDTIKNTTPTLVLQTSADSLHTRMYRSTTGNTFKISNNVSQVGAIGKAVSFDNSATQYFLAPETGLPSGTKPVLTVSMWIKVPNAANYTSLVKWGTGDSTGTYGVFLSAGSIRIGIGSSAVTGSTLTSTAVFPVPSNTWTHIAVTCDGTTTNIYLNGIVRATSTSTFTINLGTNGLSNQGTRGLTTDNGLEDQLLIYNTALSSSDIATIYNSGLGTALIPLNGLLRRYEFEEGTGTTLVDLSGNGYNGTLFNGATWTTGLTPIAGVSSEADIITSSNGVINTEKGVHTFGDFNGGSVIQGKAIRFLQNNVYPLWSDDSGRISIDNTNTGTYPTLANNFAVKGSSYFNGNVGIGTATPSEMLSVNGNIRTKELIVTQTGWPDYVFDTAYQLPALAGVSQYIRDNKHLPGVPSAKDVLDSGLNVGHNQAALLQKIEELTLYVIAQDKKQQQQAQKQDQQDQLIESQRKLIQQQQELLLNMQAQLNKLQTAK